MAEQHHQKKAAITAEELIERLGLEPPIDPLKVANTEKESLRTGGCDLGRRYDGKLEYVPSRDLFLLYYNTKYDIGMLDGSHHPRTRFSIAHELGHFFIDHHHRSLRRGARPHRSVNEYQSHRQVEREADAFAASLLMPSAFASEMVNRSQLSFERIDELAEHFATSIISTAIRSVCLSDFPCAICGIKKDGVAWMFASSALIDSGLYPKRGRMVGNALEPWSDMASGCTDRSEGFGTVRDWFQLYDRDQFADVEVFEEYHPVHSAETMLTLLSLDEDDVGDNEES